MTILYIIIGIAVVCGLFKLFSSNESDPKERAKEAAATAATGVGFAGCFTVQLILSALPIAIAIIIVLFVMRGCN